MTEHDAWLDERRTELLLQVLRTRPEASPAASETFSDEDVLRSLEILRQAGFLRGEGPQVTPVPPEEAVSRIATSALAQGRESLDALDDLVRMLPTLTEAWNAGRATKDGRLQGEVLHGSAESLMERWFSVTAERPPIDPACVYGDIAFVRAQYMPNLDAMRETFEERGHRLRLLLPVDDLADPDNRHGVDAFVGIGIDVRLASTIPSYLYNDPGVMAGVPLTWGARRPSDGLVLLYDPVLMEPVDRLFNRWWEAATPWPLEPDGWAPVLQLLATGRGDEQIAAILGLGVRTVRRRISQAMDHFGVYSRFELGMRWTQERTARDDRGPGEPGPSTS